MDALSRLLEWNIFSAAMEAQKGPHPPYTIHEIKGKFFVKNALGETKNKTGYDSEAEAKKLQQALYAALPPEMKKGGGKNA